MKKVDIGHLSTVITIATKANIIMSIIKNDVVTVSRVAILFSCLFSQGCATTSPKLTPINDLSQKIQLNGFSILPPQSKEWKIINESQYGITFGKEPISQKTGPHTFVARANIFESDIEITNKETLLEQVRESYSKEVDSRYTIVKSNFQVDNGSEAFCIKYDLVATDRGVPKHKGSIFLLNINGISCRHPNNQHLIIDLGFSQRTPPEVQPADISAECEPFLKSLEYSEFIPVKDIILSTESINDKEYEIIDEIEVSSRMSTWGMLGAYAQLNIDILNFASASILRTPLLDIHVNEHPYEEQRFFPTEKTANILLKEKAREIGADAVINVTYKKDIDPSWQTLIDQFSAIKITAKGKAIKFVK